MTKTIKTIIGITTIVLGYYCATIFYPNLFVIPLSKYFFLTTNNYSSLYITIKDTINVPVISNKECTIVSKQNLTICIPKKQIEQIKEYKNNTKLVITKEKNKNIVLLSDTSIKDLIGGTISAIESTPYEMDHFNALGKNAFNDPYSMILALFKITPSDIYFSRNAGENYALLTFLLLKSGEIKSFSKVSNLYIDNHKGYQLGSPSTDSSTMIYLFDETGTRYSIVFSNGHDQNSINNVLSTIKIKPNKSLNSDAQKSRAS